MTATVIPLPTRIGGHTVKDTTAFLEAGLDPENHQPREHPVRCWCDRRTRNVMGLCDDHYMPPAQTAHPSTRIHPHPRHQGVQA